jgi:D-alanyl-lipoteichoic acid acyltransferase DltB (MBOAT superfamily)
VIGLVIWGMKIMIKLTIWACIACAYLVWALIAGTVMVVASMRGNERVVSQYRRSLTWKLPRDIL